jgi:hypothetical protein
MPTTSSLTVRELADEYFIENRNRLLEIAAFLDRVHRADPARASDDFRLEVFAEALTILADGRPDPLRRIQLLLSDPSSAPIEVLDRKSAIGAYDRRGQRSGS